jgi:hypothetical protein
MTHRKLGRGVCVVSMLALGAACGGDEEEPAPWNPAQGGSGATSVGGGTSAGGTSTGGTSAGGGPIGGTGGDGGASDGIAQRYPGDVGIDSDPDVIFADDFESYGQASDLWNRWDNTFQQDQTRIARESENVYAGNQAVEFTLPQQDQELSNAVVKQLTVEQDSMYLRWYSKFDTLNDIVGSSHNGGGMSAHYDSGPGVPADGTNHFLALFEHWRGEAATPSPGEMNVYVYHPEQRDIWGDHFFPSGKVLPNTSLPFDFGPDFQPHPDVIPELGRWYCYELMVKANTPGQRDGHITIWLDGSLLADFGNLRLRDVDTLKIDQFNVGFHAHSVPVETKKYYDAVVAAKSYIGPMVPP